MWSVDVDGRSRHARESFNHGALAAHMVRAVKPWRELLVPPSRYNTQRRPLGASIFAGFGESQSVELRSAMIRSFCNRIVVRADGHCGDRPTRSPATRRRGIGTEREDTVIEEIRTWATTTGAVIAGLLAIYERWTKVTEKRDRIKVGIGPLRAEIDEGESLHVVCRCDHPIEIADYGFVNVHGKLVSLPIEFQIDPAEEGDWYYRRGELRLTERNAWFEAGVRRDFKAIGAFAITSTQSRPTINFRQGTPLFQQVKARARQIVRANYN